MLIVILISILTAVPTGGLPQASGPTKLEKRVAALEEKIEALSTLLADIRRRVPRQSVNLDCNSTAYAEISAEESGLGLFVSCEKIEPYLEGYRLTLRFGNPYTFTFDGISGDIAHGADFQRSVKTRVPFSTTSSFTSGAWTDVMVTINPAAAMDVRYIWIRNLKIKSAVPTR